MLKNIEECILYKESNMSRIMEPNNLRNCFESDLEPYRCLRCIYFRTHFLHVLKQHVIEDHTAQNGEFQLYRCQNCTFETWSKYLIIRHRMFNICVADECVTNVIHMEHDHCYYITDAQFDTNILNMEHDHCYYTKDVEFDNNIPHTEHDHCYYTKDISVGKFHCEYCTYTTESKESLNSHEDGHFHKDTLARHIKDLHIDFWNKQLDYQDCSNEKNGFELDCNSENKFLCKECGFKTYFKDSMKRHHLEFHSDPSFPKFYCKYCNFKTKYKSNLRLHRIRTHTDPSVTKLLKCDKCPYKTKCKRYLRRHQQYKHSSDSQKDFTYRRKLNTEITKSIKILGLTFDLLVSWDTHVLNLSNKLSTSIFVLRRLSTLINAKYLRMAYFSVFHSKMVYGIIFWGGSAHSKEIFMLQKKAIRILAKAEYAEDCKPLFRKHRILPLPCMYIHKCITRIKSELNKTRRKDIHENHTNNKNDFTLPVLRLTKRQKPYIYLGYKFFNLLPLDIKQKHNEKCFDKTLKDFLLENCFYDYEEFYNLSTTYIRSN